MWQGEKMEYTKVEFKISESQTEKDKGIIKNVVFDVDFFGVEDDIIKKYALKNYVIEIQGQIRNNWSDFEKDGVPKVITFGQTMFGKKLKTVVKKMSSEEIMAQAIKMMEGKTPEEILAFFQGK